MCDGGSTPAEGLACWRDHELADGREVFPGNYGVREPGREAWYAFLLETVRREVSVDPGTQRIRSQNSGSGSPGSSVRRKRQNGTPPAVPTETVEKPYRCRWSAPDPDVHSLLRWPVASHPEITTVQTTAGGVSRFGCPAARSSDDDGEPLIGRVIRVAPSEDASRPFAALIDCPGMLERYLIRPSLAQARRAPAAYPLSSGRALGVGGCGAGAPSSVPHTESLFDSRLTEILRRSMHLVGD